MRVEPSRTFFPSSKIFLLLWSFSCLGFIWLLYRVHFGIDFTDEALYVAIPFQYSLGAKPFIDELAVHQGFAFLTYPFVRLHQMFWGEGPGLVLFMRYVFLLTTTFCTWLTYRLAQREWPREVALLVSMIIWAHLPFSMATLGYGSIGRLSAILGFLSLFVFLRGHGSRFGVLSNFVFLIGSIGYPTLSLVWLLSVVFSLLSLIKPKEHCIVLPEEKRPFAISFFVFGLGLVSIYYFLGINNIVEAYQFFKQYGLQGGGVEKLDEIIQLPLQLISAQWKLFTVCFGLFILAFWSRWALACLLIILPVGLSWHSLPTHRWDLSRQFVGLLTFTALPFIMHFRRAKWFRAASQILIVSFFAGIVCAWTSGGGFKSYYLGSSIGLVFYFVMACELSFASSDRRAAYLAFVGPFVCLVWLFSNQYFFIYRDGQGKGLSALVVRVSNGPFKGIYTTKERARFLSDVSSDLAAVREAFPNANSILFYDDYPAGYLLTELRQRAPTAWMPEPGGNFNRDIYLGYFSDHQPDIVFELKTFLPVHEHPLEGEAELLAGDPLRKFWAKNGYKVAVNRLEYLIWAKPNVVETP